MAEAQQTKSFLEFGPYRLDPIARVLFRDREIVPLTPKVLDMLVVLVEHAGQVVSKEELLHSVWPDSFVEESNLAQNIAVLRKMLGKSMDDGPLIETISKRGYRFVAVVRIVPAVDLAAASEASEILTPVRASATSRTRLIKLSIAAMLICGVVAFWYYRRQAAVPPLIRSLAVLPLKNLSGDAGQDYLADGVTELLTTELSQALPLRVTSGTSAMRYRDSTKTLAAIAAELKVDAVVEGSVARSGDHLRLTVQLIQARTDRHLWAETYDYFARGDVDRGLQEAQLACDLDPLSEIMQTQKAWLLGSARRHREAIEIFEKVLADHPDYQWALWQLGSQQVATRHYDAAIETLKKAVEVGKGSPSALGTLGQAYGFAGRKTEAQEILAELNRQSRERYVPPHAFVHVYIGLGDKEKAFEWLEKSYQERSNSMVWTGTTAMFDPLRPDPRFESLLRRIGLKPGDLER